MHRNVYNLILAYGRYRYASVVTCFTYDTFRMSTSELSEV